MHLPIVLACIITIICPWTTQATVEEIVAEYSKQLVLHCDHPLDYFTRVETWYMDKRDTKTNETKTVAINAENDKYEIVSGLTLKIHKVVPALIGLGRFQCVYNTNKETKTFLIYVPPKVKEFDPSTKSGFLNEPLNLQCTAWGIPEPQIIWMRNDTDVRLTNDASKYNFRISKSDDKDGFPHVENEVVRISKFEESDGGNYTCFVSNVINGLVYNASATLTIRVKDWKNALPIFFGICAEAGVLSIIILSYEKFRQRRIKIQEERTEEESENISLDSYSSNPDMNKKRKIRSRK